jgi:hypothetical protein
VVTRVQVGPTTIGTSALTLNASCPAGQMIVGGGFEATSTAVTVFRAFISTPGRGGTYTVSADDGAALGQSLTAFAYCSP